MLRFSINRAMVSPEPKNSSTRNFPRFFQREFPRPHARPGSFSRFACKSFRRVQGGVLGIKSTFERESESRHRTRGLVPPSIMDTPEAMKAIKDTGVPARTGKG